MIYAPPSDAVKDRYESDMRSLQNRVEELQMQIAELKSDKKAQAGKFEAQMAALQSQNAKLQQQLIETNQQILEQNKLMTTLLKQDQKRKWALRSRSPWVYDECAALVPTPAKSAPNELGVIKSIPDLSEQVEADPALAHNSRLSIPCNR